PLERVDVHGQAADLLVQRLDRAPVPDGPLNGGRGRADIDDHLISRRYRRELVTDELRSVAGRQLSTPEPHPGDRGFGEAIDPEGPPVVPLGVPGHEVPPAAQRDEPMRFHQPTGSLSRAGAVAEP